MKPGRKPNKTSSYRNRGERERENVAIEFLRESGGGGKLCALLKRQKLCLQATRLGNLMVLEYDECTDKTNGEGSNRDALGRWSRGGVGESNKDKQKIDDGSAI